MSDKLKDSIDRLFWSKVRKSEGCWEWQGSIDKAGYGISGIGGSAHRVSYDMCKGEIPEGMVVMHSCDNRSCVNPEHLTVGTPADNMRDKREKGRDYHGNVYSNSKLSEADVISIRESKDTNTLLATKFGVSAASISLVKTGGIHNRVGGPLREAQNGQKLSERQVREIRLNGDSMRSLAKVYGVDKTVISRIKCGTSYAEHTWTGQELACKNLGRQKGGAKVKFDKSLMMDTSRSGSQVAEDLGCSIALVNKVRQEAGVKFDHIHQFSDEQIELMKGPRRTPDLANEFGVSGHIVASFRTKSGHVADSRVYKFSDEQKSRMAGSESSSSLAKEWSMATVTVTKYRNKHGLKPVKAPPWSHLTEDQMSRLVGGGGIIELAQELGKGTTTISTWRRKLLAQ